ncbi:Piso0_003498 [Millerozyma farinosa CBS 7064]|uniref:Piso0_003498 protein n=1 Tax=Pichia sorbitophila (strain ATCC MYA-4447 / BCRC 22081 / CBS 7064 / NBRC 10061 / NRRL Y-12695) TaxID=559304 RepID=G8YI95_PICSO|nr:Piso0_003498 [Millerozyma farinosa CBS 7064]CCE81147.1 Piso0_003498 [Millerozyma farinosa CBS 7064]
MLFKSIVKAAMVAGALSAPLHQHHEHKMAKKDVVQVTTTNLVQVTATVGAANGAANSGSTGSPAGSSPAGGESSSAESSSASSSSEAPSPASSSSSSSGSSTSSGSGSIPSSIGSGGAKGITYSPYTNDGGCKSSSQIKSELEKLSGFDIIRLYGTDCDQVAAVLSAKSSSQKVFAGINDVQNIDSAVSSIASAVKNHGSWDDIATVSVGNELVNSGQANPSQVKQYIDKGRSALKSAGYNGKVVSVDTFIAVINNKELCDLSDYIAVNAHAFFDGNVGASDAGKWVLQQIQRVSSACGGKKEVLITETGWPSKGDSNGAAIPSRSNQQSAISSIKKTCGNDAILFTAYNDMWKSSGAFNAEQYWGIYSD